MAREDYRGYGEEFTLEMFVCAGSPLANIRRISVRW